MLGPTAVHHTTYKRLGNEALKDLAQLCHECHDLLHQYVKIGRGKPSKVHHRLGRRWLKYVQEHGLWPVRKHHPSEFKRLAHEFFIGILGSIGKQPMPDTKVEWLIAEHGDDTQPQKPKLSSFQKYAISVAEKGGAISDRGRSPLERDELRQLTEDGKLQFSNGMYSLMLEYDKPWR